MNALLTAFAELELPGAVEVFGDEIGSGELGASHS